jgi:hypothetical protein
VSEAGFGAFGLVRFLAIIVVLYMMVAMAGQCAQRAPQVAGEAATTVGQVAGNAVAGFASSVAQAAYCALPLIDCSTNKIERFAQCLSSGPTPSYRCLPYDSVEQAAASALSLARLGTKCYGVEFVGLIYTHSMSGIPRVSFVGPFAGDVLFADLALSKQVLAQIGVTASVAIYHSHPPSRYARFSLGDMQTAVKEKKLSYVVGTNWDGGDGSVNLFVPTVTTLPEGWQSGAAPDSSFDEFIYKWLAWGAIRETWYDWVSAPDLGNIESLGSLGSAGELVDAARQCPDSSTIR